MNPAKKIRVLIAEDDPATGVMLTIALSTTEIEPIWVSDGVDALESIEDQRPDVLLTDIDMPRKDGITLIKEVRTLEESQHSPDRLPIIVMSGRSDKFGDAAQAGATSCFSKPFADLARIIERIKELIHRPLITDPLYGAV